MLPILILLLLVDPIRGSDRLLQYYEPNDSHTSCLLSIFTKYFTSENVVVGLRKIPHKSKDLNLLQFLNSQLKWTVYQVNTNKIVTYKKTNNTIDNYILEIFQEQDIEQDLRFLRSNLWNPQARFVVITNRTQNKDEMLQTVFNQLWKYKVVNVIIISPQNKTNHVFEVHTWYPYRNGNCGKYNESVLLDTCENGEMKLSKNLFPEKIPKNLNNCPIRIRTVIWPPYVIAPSKYNESQIGINFTKGIEIQLMNTIAKTLNFKTVYTLPSKPEDWGYVYENGTATGVFKSLTDEEVDIGISSLAGTVNRYEYLDPSVPYTTESLTWCVPSAILKPKWLNVFNIFGIVSWINIYITFVIIVLFSILFAKISNESTLYKDAGNCIINMFAVFNGLSLHKKPDTVSLRIVFWLCAFFHLIISSIYQTSLISFLTEPAYEKQIKTVQEIFDNNLNFYILPASQMYFTWDVDDWRSQKILNEMVSCTDTRQCINYIAHYRNFSMATPRLFLLYIANSFVTKEGHPLIYWFKEDMMSFPVQMFMTKGFPLRKRINLRIAQILQTGIHDKWQKDLKYLLKEKESMIDTYQNTNEKDPKILTLGHLQGAFIILLFGTVISGLVFLTEILYYNYKKQ